MKLIHRRSALKLAVASLGVSALTTPVLAAPAKVPVIWDGKAMYETFTKDGVGFSFPGPAGRPKVHVAFDPQCPDCIRFHDRIKPLLDKVEVVYYPVAMLNIHSEPQGALMLSSPEPWKVFEEHHEKFRDPDFRGVRYDLSKLSDKVRNDVWTNTKLHRRCGCRAIPFGVFKNSKGEFIALDENLLTSELAQIFELQ